MLQLIQALWDQMRADLGAGGQAQLEDACQALLSGRLGALTEHQKEDLESIQRSADKLARRIDGEPINWSDYSEAAHALRGPLNSTIGFSRLMLKGVEGPITAVQGEALETIYGVSRRMLVLFNLLLDALVFHNDDVAMPAESAPIDAILGELVAVGNTLADNRGIVFKSQVSAAAAGTVLDGDAQHLKKTLIALLAVATKYTRQGPVTLTAWVAEKKLHIQIESPECQLPALLTVNLATLLTDQADPGLPYDAHLRLGLAWRSIAATNGQLEAQLQSPGETAALLATWPTAP